MDTKYEELCEAERLASARYVDADEAAELAAEAVPHGVRSSHPAYQAWLKADEACVLARKELDRCRDARIAAEGSR